MFSEESYITIVCATYNAEKTLSNFLLSVRNQTLNRYELIVVDGGSSDNTIEIIRSNKDIISCWITEKDKGIYDAWNKGVKLSNTEWICFVGADDYLKPDFVEIYSRLISNIKGDEVDYISSKVNYINEKGQVIRILGKAWIWKEFRKQMTTAHVGSLHNKRLFEQVGFYNIKYKIIGDYELLLRKKEKLKALFIDEVTVDMKAGGVSLSYKALVERYKAQRNTARVSIIISFTQLILDAISLFKLKLDVSKTIF
jgi:glycosyltransferase involved in cell wall biosynthesis